MPYKYDKLKGRIKEKYGSQTEFAKALGNSPQWVSHVLNGKSGLSQKNIEKWAELLDISVKQYPQYFFA